MIQANQKIFDRLINWAQRSGRAIGHLHNARWIETNEDEKQWLKNVDVGDVRTFSPRVRVARCSFSGRNYFVVFGFAEKTEPDSVFEPAEWNSGFFTAVISELNVPIRDGVDPLAIVDEVLPQYDGVADYTYLGHSFSSIANFFEPVAVYEIRPDSPIRPDDLARLSCFWMLQNRERVVLPFSANTLSEIEELTVTGASTVPFDVLLNAIHSAQWQHAFLELYRCVERLFAFQIIEDLHQELSLSIPLLKFAEKIETAIGWKPHEEDAMARLFSLLPSDASVLMESVRRSVGSNPAEKIHRWVYDLRNSVVHFRPATKRFSLTDAQWDDMVRATVLLIVRIYGAYDHHLQAA
jgi:hypothetical protein